MNAHRAPTPPAAHFWTAALLVTTLLAVVAQVAPLARAEDREKENEKTLVNTSDAGLAVKGYDVVAYFTEEKAVRGEPEHKAKHKGATYRFKSAKNKATFEKNPAKYTPLFGGYCAWAASRNYLAKIDPTAFAMVDGQLILQYSKSVAKQYAKDTEGNTNKAKKNWPGLVKKHGK